MTGFIAEIPRGNGYAFAATNDGPGWAFEGSKRPARGMGPNNWDGDTSECIVIPAYVQEWARRYAGYGCFEAPFRGRLPNGRIIRGWCIV